MKSVVVYPHPFLFSFVQEGRRLAKKGLPLPPLLLMLEFLCESLRSLFHFQFVVPSFVFHNNNFVFAHVLLKSYLASVPFLF